MPKNTSAARKVAEGLGIAALAGAAAATYFFYGKAGEKHRKQAAAWSKSAKAEMVKKLKVMKTVSKKTYDDAAREVMAKYKQAKNIDPKELTAFGAELKQHWENISRQALKLGAKPAKSKAAVKAKKRN
jgi:hypothetical protein